MIFLFGFLVSFRFKIKMVLILLETQGAGSCLVERIVLVLRRRGLDHPLRNLDQTKLFPGKRKKKII